MDVRNPEDAIVQSADVPHRACGMEEHMEELMLNPDYAEFHQRKFVKLETANFNGRANVVIPVAVHYQRLRGSIDVQCLRDQAQNQIDILNADYGGTNSDISEWNNNASSFFPGVSNGQAAITFELANINHPSGYGLVDGDPAVTINATRGDSDRNWAGYLNIFVRNIQYLGYSPLGGDGDGDGVVIDDEAFGSGSGCGDVTPGYPYDLGRTLTHELGHYLLLDHIWGGGCGSDDGVGDTPDSSGPYYSGETTFCPELGVASCGSTDMHMNYMDYVYDACMYMFSAGQATRMENYVASSLAVLVNNAPNVIDDGGTPPPTGDCVVPTGLSSSVNKKKVNLSWDNQSGTTFEVRYRELGGAWTTVSSSTNSTTLNGMRNGDYEFQVRAVCGTTTDWSASAFFSV
ncbi:M43 family zinc metalloprotease [Flavilitoribacter nigricans]|uniref:M43 family zinc metalloprotease n=1 Tax=Flavilitoribacter nigricans TaxID=70997 RepID=UPI00147298B9|nr:M43 family zinc metalloprotease [Flavilitoribacter nigricans]